MDLTARDLLRLQGVHPDLVKVVHAAAAKSLLPFFVIEGLRTAEQEALDVAAGKSKAKHSRHIGGFAVDLGITLSGVLTWEEKYYNQLSDIMLSVAANLKIPLVWGGSWTTLKDCDHWELNRNFYPDAPQPVTKDT